MQTPDIEKAKEFGRVSGELFTKDKWPTTKETLEKNKKEKPEPIYAVVIIGLKSGERIMKDMYSELGLQDELKAITTGLNEIEKCNFTRYLFGSYYFNGQRHIKVFSIMPNQIESVSFTDVSGGGLYASNKN